MLNAISIDVEDYFHAEAMSPAAPRDGWEALPSRVQANTERLFEIFERHHTKATFFFLGWVAERFPSLVGTAVRLGHEIGCHSYWHTPVFRLSPAEFREDTIRAKAVIENAAGVAVRGYRAPSFSMTPGTEWAGDVLAELGFTYDTSVYPVRHDFYSNADAPRFPYRVSQGALCELPIATVEVAGIRVPIGGGAYLRIFPLAYTSWGIARLNAYDGRAAMIYLHPWEIDPRQPRLEVPVKSRLRHYTKLAGTEAKLERLLEKFKFGPIREVFKADIQNAEIAPVSKMSATMA